jgi:hypothetical protein
MADVPSESVALVLGAIRSAQEISVSEKKGLREKWLRIAGFAQEPPPLRGRACRCDR